MKRKKITWANVNETTHTPSPTRVNLPSQVPVLVLVPAYKALEPHSRQNCSKKLSYEPKLVGPVKMAGMQASEKQ